MCSCQWLQQRRERGIWARATVSLSACRVQLATVYSLQCLTLSSNMVSVYRRQSSLIAASMDGDPMQQQERERERLRVSLRSDIAELYAMCRLYADFPKLGQPFL